MPLLFSLDSFCPLDLPRTPLPTSVSTTDDLSRLFVTQKSSIVVYPPPKSTINTKRRLLSTQFIPNLQLLMVISDSRVEFWNSIDLKPSDLSFSGKITSFKVWSNSDYSFDDINNDQLSLEFNDPNVSSDSISLATIIHDEDQDTQIISDVDTINLVSLICENQIVIFKWINGKFNDKYSIHLSNISHLMFLNQFELHLISNNNINDLITINLQSQQVHHKDISQLDPPVQSQGFFSFHSNPIIDLLKFKSNLIILKSHQIIKSLNFQLIDEYQISDKLKFHSIISPFLVLVFDNKIDILSLISFTVIQSIKFTKLNPISISTNLATDSIQILTPTKILNLQMQKIWDLLDSLSNSKLFDEAIDLTLNLSLSKFKSTQNFSSSELKFIKIRKYQLLKAQSLMVKGDFNDAINLFIEYLAPPDLVFKTLPLNIRDIMELKSESEVPNELTTETKDTLYQLINFLNDSKRKLLRLIDKSNEINFKWKNLQISLLIYKFDNPDFKILDNLIKIDNYLFNCYLILNPKVINSFLRQKNYCSIELVEEKCIEFNYTPQLLEFYFNRGQTEKLIDSLIKLNDSDLKINYFKKMIINTPKKNLDLILSNVSDILNEESFIEIFQNPSIDYNQDDITKILNFLTSRENLSNLLIPFLEFIIFDQQIINSNLINTLFIEYFKDVDSNFEKIQSLYKMGNYNATNLIKTLRGIINGQSESIKRLQIEPLLKLGKYDEILEILVLNLNDINGAIDFSLRVKILKNESLSKGLIFKILDLLLTKNDELSIIKHLLQNPSLQFVDFEEILDKLPNRMTSNFLKEFLILNLKNLNEKNKNLIIRNENLKIKLINLNFKKVKYEKESNKVSQNSKCKKCGLKFNKSEMLCFKPNNDIIHYGCSK